MHIRVLLLTSLLLFAFTTACTQAPPPDTHAADVQALKDTEAAWVKVIAAKDFEKFMGYYADDASVLMPNAPAINGKDAIRAAFKPFFDDPNFAMTFQGSRFEVAKSATWATRKAPTPRPRRTRKRKNPSPTRANT
jgi:hypothetical protein